ncbi:MAG TPA: aldo/keto reductase [Candidatus Enterenecus stercoripullorum]|nr:aldo/keto reductase [Candidatus Enterenecus stercoripullorum]
MKKLGFGCMRFPLRSPDDPTSVDLEQVKTMVDRFLERGFTYFDTAYFYHKGTSEGIVRQVLVNRHPRDSFTLADKLPLSMLKDKTREDQAQTFHTQLERCGVDYFDYYLLHNVNAESYETALRLGSFSYLLEQKEKGFIRHLGFSFHDSAKVLDRVLREHPEVEFVQLQLNYLDWESPSVQSRLCYETALRHGKQVVVMEPVKGGKLADPSPEVAQLFHSHDPNSSLSSWAIRFAASLEQVIVVLSGMSSLEQVEDNTCYMSHFVPLSTEELSLTARAAQLIRGDGTVPCTACSYCTEGCPSHIPIPAILSLYNDSIRAPGEKDYHAEYQSLPVNSEACVYCGQCRRACPQHIDVITALQDAHAVLGEVVG